MTRVDTTRSQLKTLARAVPFEPYVINLENGDRVAVEHPENVAFDPTEGGSQRLYIISGKLAHHSNLSAVSSVALMDRGDLPPAESNGRG